MTLRGIGPYLYGAELEIRPLTILCGENGSGKSTWFAVLEMLKRCQEDDRLPFSWWQDLDSGDHDFTNAFLRSEEMAAERLRDDQADVRFGQVGAIGLQFVAVEELSLDGQSTEAARPGSGPTMAQAFLWEGRCPSGTRFRLRIAHPSWKRMKRTVGDLVELQLDGRYLVRFERGGNQDRYTFSCSRAFLPGDGAGEATVKQLAEVEVSHTEFEVHPTADAGDVDLIRSICGKATDRIRQLLEAVLSGFFYIGAIRTLFGARFLDEQGQMDLDKPYERLGTRYVGAEGGWAHKLERAFACNLMRQARPPHTGRIPQWFETDEVNGLAVCHAIRSAKETGGASPKARLWELAGPELQQLILSCEDPFGREYGTQEQEAATARVVELLNSVLPRRNFYRAEDWPEVGDEARPLMDRHPLGLSEEEQLELARILAPGEPPQHPDELWSRLRRLLLPDEAIYLVRRGPENLAEDEVLRLNRLLIECLFPGGLAITQHRAGFLFNTYVSFWLERLAGARSRVRGGHGHLVRGNAGSLADCWRDPDGSDPPLGYLVHGEPRPQPLPGGGYYHTRGEGYETDPATTIRYGTPSIADPDLPASPAWLSGGFHQVFPMIVQAGLMRRNEMMSLENPEVHLHPSLQLKVAEFLMKQASTGKVLLVETHSDLIVRRVIRAILAEEVKQEEVRIFFSHLVEGPGNFLTSTLQALSVNSHGQINNWPKGFLDDDVVEARRLLDVMYGAPFEEEDE
jgi:hypothetical protein